MNLLQTGILARLLLGLAATAALGYASIVAARALVRWDPSRASESQLALERRGMLASSLVATALFGQLAALALSLLLADRLTGSIRGAMCAYGVLTSAPGGFAALGASSIAAVGSVVWLAVDRVDSGSEGLSILRTKLFSTVPLAALATLDLWLTSRFLLSLDFASVASCCSVTLDAGASTVSRGLQGGARTTATLLAAVLSMAAAAACLALARRGGAARAGLAGALSLASVIPAVVAVAGFVAPHVYETPAHLCPFCLLKSEHGGLGWALGAALFVGASAGLAAAVVQPLARRPDAAPAVRRVQGTMGRTAAVAWIAFLVLAAAPPLMYLSASGGRSLFG